MRTWPFLLGGLIAAGFAIHACSGGAVKPDPGPGTTGSDVPPSTNTPPVVATNRVEVPAEETNRIAPSEVLRLVNLTFMIEDTRPESTAPRRLVLGSGVRIRLEPAVLFRNEDIEEGYIQYDTIFEQHVLWLRFTPAAAVRFAEVTRAAVGKRLAILLDDEIWVAPRITEEIKHGTAIVAGRDVQPRLRRLAERIGQIRGENR